MLIGACNVAQYRVLAVVSGNWIRRHDYVFYSNLPVDHTGLCSLFCQEQNINTSFPVAFLKNIQ